MSREHNNANVLCMGERTTGVGLAEMITDTWLETEFAFVLACSSDDIEIIGVTRDWCRYAPL